MSVNKSAVLAPEIAYGVGTAREHDLRVAARYVDAVEDDIGVRRPPENVAYAVQDDQRPLRQPSVYRQERAWGAPHQDIVPHVFMCIWTDLHNPRRQESLYRQS